MRLSRRLGMMILALSLNALPAFSGEQAAEQKIKIDFYNSAILESNYLVAFERIGKEYRDFLARNVNQFNTQLKNFNDEIHIKGIVKFSDESNFNLNPSTPNINQFFSALRSYETGMEELKASLNSLYVIPSLTMAPEKFLVSHQAIGNVDFSPLISFYQEQISKIENKVKELRFKLVLPNGQLYFQNGLNTEDLRQMNLLSSNEINQMRRRAAQLKVMKTADRLLIDQSYNRFVFDKVKVFVDTFGVTQKYRIQKNIDALEAAKQDLQEAFWTRSYLRATYGIKLGSFGVEFNKRWFNLDYFFNATKIKFLPRVVMNENDLMKIQDQIFYALRMTEGRSKDVLALSTPFFARIMSVGGLLKGDKAEANANLVVLKLIMADVYEELMLGKGGGFRKMRAHYRDRYYSNAADEAYFKKMSKDYVPDSLGVEDDYQTMDVDSLRGVFQASLLSLQNYETQLIEAQGIMETIRRMTPKNDRHEI